MAEIVSHIGGRNSASKLEEFTSLPASELRLTVDDISHPAYMVNYNLAHLANDVVELIP